jgi:hypothetical protein
MIKLPTLVLIAGPLLAGAAIADPPRSAEYNLVSASLVSLESFASAQHDAHLTRVGQQKLALRHEALRLQAGDGGSLTPEHRAYLQHKLDRINRS